jgi:hypothetical protein
VALCVFYRKSKVFKSNLAIDFRCQIAIGNHLKFNA